MSRPDEKHPGIAWWHRVVPLVAMAAMAVTWGRPVGPATAVALAAVLIAAVLSAVHHAEVLAVGVGEPYGSLILALAVTVLEVAMIIGVISHGGSGSASMARDTAYSALMITMNGILGISLLAATRRGREAVFTASGAVAGLSAIAVLATLVLVLPDFTTSSRPGTLTAGQLAVICAMAVGVYGLYVMVAAVRHRDYFLPEKDEDYGPDEHVSRPSGRETWASAGLLLAALAAVVGLSESIAPALQSALAQAGLPPATAAVAIAGVVLAPEAIAAVRAARRGRFQTSVNLAYGSAMASIGLSLPVVAAWCLVSGHGIELGLGSVQIVLLAASAFTGLATVVGGKATALQGGVHLMLAGAFLLTTISP